MRVSSAAFVLGYTFLALLALGTAFGQDTNFATGPQYLMNSDPTNHGSPLFARPISTPSLSLSAPPLEAGASNATAGLAAGADNQTTSPRPSPAPELFPVYYGAPHVGFIEISFPESEVPQELPASILDTGVWQTATAQTLREHGYGLTVVEAAAHSKAQTRHAKRVYTNDDIDRLHGGS
jgi:hypothetical protein